MPEINEVNCFKVGSKNQYVNFQNVFHIKSEKPLQDFWSPYFFYRADSVFLSQFLSEN